MTVAAILSAKGRIVATTSATRTIGEAVDELAKRKIGALVLVAIAGLAIVSAFSVWKSQRQIVDSRRGQLVAAVQSAHNIVAAYQAKAAAGTMPEEEAQKAAKEICKLRYEAFGCAGQAAKIKPVSLEKMAERYKKGELNQIVR